MRRKIVAIIVLMLMISAPLFSIVSAGSEEDPEVEDRIFDVKLFGTIPFFPQMKYKTADFESVWFFEEEQNPEYIYVCMKLRDLSTSSETYDFIYVVDWFYNEMEYGVVVHLLPSGLTSFLAGIKNEKGNDYVEYAECQGTFDENTKIITWIVDKEDIGNPMKWAKITNIIPSTHIRFPLDSGKVKFDLFKDLPWNAKLTKDYTIKY